jgi:hypothetical protein
MRVFWVAVLMIAGFAATAEASDSPRYWPNRDAAITYRSTGSDPTVPPNLIIRYFAAGQRLRIEGGPLGYLLVDRTMERIELVMPQQHLVMQMPQGGGITDGFILGNHLQFNRTGQDTVLGRACTLYDVTAERARGKVCLTADGLLLRGEGQGRDGRKASIEATAVALATQPAGLFSPPEGYLVMAIPR